MNEPEVVSELLRKTSRTLALSIPLLPEPMRAQVPVAHLVFRTLSTLESALAWSPARRVAALGELCALLAGPSVERAARVAGGWVRERPVERDAQLMLLAETPRVIAAFAELPAPVRASIEHYAARSATRLARFVARADARGVLHIDSLDELGDYCFASGGILAQMLTELFVLSRPRLKGLEQALAARAPSFGEGLQLVSILKEASVERPEGWLQLSRTMSLAPVFERASKDLVSALEYCELLHAAGERGLWAFNLLGTRLALASLRLLGESQVEPKLALGPGAFGLPAAGLAEAAPLELHLAWS